MRIDDQLQLSLERQSSHRQPDKLIIPTMEISSPEVPSRKARKISAKFFGVALFFLVILVLIVVICFVLSPAKYTRGPLTQTKLGAIRGHYLTSYKGNQYEAYEGIPYAQPPIGQRRFQSPIPIEPWSRELQATKVKAKCLQDVLDHPDAAPIGSENCLYLNVYVPKKKETNKSVPVIFYLHGGYLRFGGPRQSEEMYIIDYDVIFVAPQFRIGVLGFLSTQDDVVPGNMGLKDQSMALRWIYDNIEAFGGDPKRIALIAGSSGGVSAHLHSLSVWSRGLFHAGMTLSGSAFVPWAIVEHSREKAIALGREVNCSQEDIERMVECMRAIPGDQLVAAQNKLQMWGDAYYGIFGPVVENLSKGIEPFIDDYPSRIFKKGRAYDVPWTMGFVPGEGIPLIAAYTNDTFKYVDEHWDSLAPIVLDYTYTIPEEQHANVAQRIRKHYLDDKPINRKNLQALAHLVGNRLFSIGIINSVKVQAIVNKSPVFLYYYTYRATDSISNKYSNSTEDFGTTHGDDLHLVMQGPVITPTKSDKDMAMQRLLIKKWISVAYNGVPDIGVKWPSVTLDNRACLDYIHLAGPGDYRLECNDNLAEIEFWNSINFDEK